MPASSASAPNSVGVAPFRPTMARENVPEKSESRNVPEKTKPSSVPESKRIDITCPQCESRWTCGDPADPTCPDCETSFSVRVRDEFALVERGGWTVAVSLATSDWQGVVDG